MFTKVFDFVIKIEGGFKLHKNVTEDTVTYAGIYRAAHPNWIGWTFIDNGEEPPVSMVQEVYREAYWDKIPLEDGPMKGLIFEYGVNAGMGRALRTAQTVAGVDADGNLGPVSKKALEAMDFKLFLVMYNMERVKYYAGLANKNARKYDVYFRGWVNRVLESQKWFEEHSA